MGVEVEKLAIDGDNSVGEGGALCVIYCTYILHQWTGTFERI